MSERVYTPDEAAVLHRIRTGEGQCVSEHDVEIGFQLTTRDRCLDATDHDGRHQGVFGEWGTP
jgi:hypothetical protein